MTTDTPWSARMADTVLNRLADLPPAWSHEYGALFMGMLAAWRRTGDRRYFDYVKRHIDAVVDENGIIDGYRLEKYSLDDLISGRMLFPLFDETADKRYLAAAATLREHFRSHPRTGDGGFWHNGGLVNQMLLDGIYMATPFYAEYAVRNNDSAGLDDAVNQPLLLVRHCRDSVSGLYRHGWDSERKQDWADPETGLSASFWGRAMGWFSMALVDLLNIVPKTHSRYAELESAYRDLMTALVAVQDSESGLWWQVVDQGGREGNYLESSASFMILYALAEGLSGGYLSEEPFRAAVDKAFRGATERLIVDNGALLTVKNTCKTAGLGVKPGRDGSFSYYISEPMVDDDIKGVAGFLLAASACEA